jgi:hypothetical protein
VVAVDHNNLMTDVTNKEAINPYEVSAVPVRGLTVQEGKLVRKLRFARAGMTGLGAIWIFIGASTAHFALNMPVSDDAVLLINLVILGGLVWMLVGMFVCLKRTWALYMLLGLSYASLGINIWSIKLVPAGIVLFLILMCHAVLWWIRALRAIGVSPMIRPHDLELQLAATQSP